MNRLQLPWKKKKTGGSEPSDSSAVGLPQAADEPEEADGSRLPDSRTPEGPPKKPADRVPVHRWFVTLMSMNIPVIGWIYLIILALSPSKGPLRDFAKAYLLYKFLFLTLTVAVLAVAFHYGMQFLDQVLAYMEML